MVSNKFILLRSQQRYVAGKDRLQFFAIKNNQIDRYFLNLFRRYFKFHLPFSLE